jgi:hypothetical protein
MKYNCVNCKFLAKYANTMNQSINLSLIGLLIIPILSVAFTDVNGTAYAQLLSNNVNTKEADRQTSAGQIRPLLENTVLQIGNNDTTRTTPISSNTTGISSVSSSNARCTVVPGPAMTFHEICSNRNNASVVQTRQQPVPGTSFPSAAPALSSVPAVNATAPFTPLRPLQQPPIPENPPLIPQNSVLPRGPGAIGSIPK